MVKEENKKYKTALSLLDLKGIRLLLVVLLLSPFLVAGQTVEDPTVQAILFYSPSCPHCHQVLKEIMVPLKKQYGHQLQIVGIDTSQSNGKEFYLDVIRWFEVPDDRQVVPTLIVGETVLVSSSEISDHFASLIEEGLAAGGISWPNIPDLYTALPDLTSNNALATEGNGAFITLSPERETRSAMSEGFVLAWMVLLGMGMALIYSVHQVFFAHPPLSMVSFLYDGHRLSWAIPVMALTGMAVASYLSYVEVARAEAVCGPVGACSIVQTSSYARLLGMPIAILGALSYMAIIGLWIGQQFLHGRISGIMLLGLCLLTVIGTCFSVYLTLLELFAIKAICAWCLLSAVLMTVIMILVMKALTRRPSQEN